ncbi:MAG: hypothetical protein ACXAAQ_10590 [Candidatus Thorarchaeota archaeon]|jgi:hypothetical protein
MSSLVYIPIENERVLSQHQEYILTNYRLIQFDRGSRTSASIPLHIIKEYKLTPSSAMFKVSNGIVNVVGAMVRREEMRAALGLREFDRLNVGGQRKICEVSGVPFIHPEHPYNRWISIGFHKPFSRHFYLTNYRLYQYDAKAKKVFMFPLHMVETFESRGDKLKIKATSGNFEMRGRVPRQDHIVGLWQNRAWDKLPKDHLDWMVRPFSYITPHHPLSQYVVSDSASVVPTPVATETTQEVTSTGRGGAGTVFVKPVIKDKCTNCNSPMTWESIDWTGPDQFSCPACNTPHRVDYVRM